MGEESTPKKIPKAQCIYRNDISKQIEEEPAF